MKKNLTLNKNNKSKNKKSKKLKWASLMIAGLMTINSCAPTFVSRREKRESEKISDEKRTEEIAKTEEKKPAGVDLSSKPKMNNEKENNEAEEKVEKQKTKNIEQNTDHMYDVRNMERMRWRGYFETGTFTLFSFNFGKPGRKIERKEITKDPYFSITELDNIRNPLNPHNLERSDPQLYRFLEKQTLEYNEKNPDNQKTIEDFILNYIRFFGFDILDQIKDGRIRFERIKK